MSDEGRRRSRAEIVRALIEVPAEARGEIEACGNLETIDDMCNHRREGRRRAGHTGVTADDEGRLRRAMSLLEVLAESGAILEDADARSAMAAMRREAQRADDDR